jgi:hypothetical protein
MVGIPPLAIGRAKRPKYGNTPCELDNLRFASKAEMRRYGVLALLQKAREIDKLEVHPKYPISINGIQVCVVEMDFAYVDRAGAPHVEDVKGRDNPLSKLKRKLFEAYTGLRVEVVK